MEFKAHKVIEDARTDIHTIIENLVMHTYLELNDNKCPNFDGDSEFELDFEFTFNQVVNDTYTCEDYCERRTSYGISCALDGMVYLTRVDDVNDEKDIYELSTDEMVELANELELYYNRITKNHK